MKDTHPQASTTRARATQPADQEKGTEGPSPPLQGLPYNNDIDNANLITQGEFTHTTRAWLKMDCTVLPIVTGIFFLCFLVRLEICHFRDKIWLIIY